MIFGILLLLLLLLPAGKAPAADFSGYAEAKGFAYTERPFHNDPTGWGTVFGKWERKAGEAQLTASLRGEWISSEEGGEFSFDPADRRPRRSVLSVRDLWVRYPLAPSLDLQAGRFQLGWGKTDGYSPADAFLPRDLTDPFADEKLPLWALRLSGQQGALRFEAVVSPVTTPWRLPPLGSRNAPLAGEGVPAGTVFREVESDPPLMGFSALRLLATFGDWDVGLWGRSGVRPAPLLIFRLDQATASASGITIPVERRYAHEDAVGAELSRIVGSWIVRGEAAALFSRDPLLGDALIGALSAERGFGDGTLLLTLAGNALATPVDSSLLFDRGLLPELIAAWNKSEPWGGWKVVWTSGLSRGDGLLKTELSYNITDFWNLTVGGVLPYGDRRGALGSLHGAQRLQAALRRSW